jgi:hypothetical protein
MWNFLMLNLVAYIVDVFTDTFFDQNVRTKHTNISGPEQHNGV